MGELSVAHLKRHVLTNVGLLQAMLFSKGSEVLQARRDCRRGCTRDPAGLRRPLTPCMRPQVSMVTQVTPNPDGTLTRSIYDPLE